MDGQTEVLVAQEILFVVYTTLSQLLSTKRMVLDDYIGIEISKLDMQLQDG